MADSEFEMLPDGGEMSNRVWLHLDLKGAAPKIDYLTALLHWLRKNVEPINGILIEYEDKFPYNETQLPDIGYQPYSINEIIHLNEICRVLGFEICPLVQSIGHLEFVLKQPRYKHLRELSQYPNCLDVAASDEDFERVFKPVFGQVLTAHPDAKFFHVGGDEVWHLARGENAQKRLQANPNLTPFKLYLRHLRRVVKLVKSLKPDLEKILVWDDMLRGQEPVNIYGLEDVAPVIWNYLPSVQLPPKVNNLYSPFERGVFVASAFKGASSSCALIPPIKRHVDNNVSWRRQGYLKFMNRYNGIIMTGWQRFDHFAGLCELLPVAIPSLMLCVKAFTEIQYRPEDVKEVSELIFPEGHELHINGEPSPYPINEDAFPGVRLFGYVQRLCEWRNDVRNLLRSDDVATWASDYHLEDAANRVSPVQGRRLFHRAQELHQIMVTLNKVLQPELEKIYPQSVCLEFCLSHITSDYRPLEDLLKKLQFFSQQ